MNTEAKKTSVVLEIAPVIDIADANRSVIRVLDLKEILLVAGGPETDPTSGSI